MLGLCPLTEAVVVRRTDKAILFEVTLFGGRRAQHWVPKSQITWVRKAPHIPDWLREKIYD